ncbi:MAG: hypothetical protein AAF615_06145 [Pseudomonadota bacterium]
MRMRTLLMSGTGAIAVLLAYQTIQAVGSHVPIEEHQWVPPTVAAGMAPAEVILAANNAAQTVPRYEIPGAVAMSAEESSTLDVSALHFFAAEGNEEAIAAEVARLQEIDPSFTFDADSVTTGDEDVERALWERLEQGDLAGAEAELASLATVRPEVTLSAPLKNAIADKTARAALSSAAASEDWPAVLDAARSRPSLLVCGELNILWTVAEAFARTGEADHAKDVYAFAMANCPSDEDKVATLQKAGALLPSGTVMALAAPSVEVPGLGEARNGVLRAAIGRSLTLDRGRDTCPARPVQAQAGVTQEPLLPNGRAVHDPEVSAEEAARAAEQLAENADEAADHRLLGWYHMARGNYADADGWFEKAYAKDGDLSAIDGRIASHIAADDLPGVRAIAKPHWNADARIACLYVQEASRHLHEASVEERQEIETLITRRKDGRGATLVGWHHLNTGSPASAKSWFGDAMAWAPSEDAAMGLAVSHGRMDERAEVFALARKYGERYPKLAVFAREIGPRPVPVPSPRRVNQAPTEDMAVTLANRLTERAGEAFALRNYLAAAEYLEERRKLVPEDRGIALWRAWAYHNGRRHFDANRLFAALDREHSTEETREGVYHSRKMMFPQYK